MAGLDEVELIQLPHMRLFSVTKKIMLVKYGSNIFVGKYVDVFESTKDLSNNLGIIFINQATRNKNENDKLGSRYEGQVELSLGDIPKRQGFGIEIASNGSIACGQFKDDALHGIGLNLPFYHGNDSLVNGIQLECCLGEFAEGKMNGLCVKYVWRHNGEIEVYSGEIYNDQKNGFGELLKSSSVNKLESIRGLWSKGKLIRSATEIDDAQKVDDIVLQADVKVKKALKLYQLFNEKLAPRIVSIRKQTIAILMDLKKKVQTSKVGAEQKDLIYQVSHLLLAESNIYGSVHARIPPDLEKLALMIEQVKSRSLDQRLPAVKEIALPCDRSTILSPDRFRENPQAEIHRALPLVPTEEYTHCSLTKDDDHLTFEATTPCPSQDIQNAPDTLSVLTTDTDSLHFILPKNNYDDFDVIDLGDNEKESKVISRPILGSGSGYFTAILGLNEVKLNDDVTDNKDTVENVSAKQKALVRLETNFTERKEAVQKLNRLHTTLRKSNNLCKATQDIDWNDIYAEALKVSQTARDDKKEALKVDTTRQIHLLQKTLLGPQIDDDLEHASQVDLDKNSTVADQREEDRKYFQTSGLSAEEYIRLRKLGLLPGHGDSGNPPKLAVAIPSGSVPMKNLKQKKGNSLIQPPPISPGSTTSNSSQREKEDNELLLFFGKRPPITKPPIDHQPRPPPSAPRAPSEQILPPDYKPKPPKRPPYPPSLH